VDEHGGQGGERRGGDPRPLVVAERWVRVAAVVLEQQPEEDRERRAHRADGDEQADRRAKLRADAAQGEQLEEERDDQHPDGEVDEQGVQTTEL
jgi:hypothetical protein